MGAVRAFPQLEDIVAHGERDHVSLLAFGARWEYTFHANFPLLSFPRASAGHRRRRMGARWPVPSNHETANKCVGGSFKRGRFDHITSCQLPALTESYIYSLKRNLISDMCHIMS